MIFPISDRCHLLLGIIFLCLYQTAADNWDYEDDDDVAPYEKDDDYSPHMPLTAPPPVVTKRKYEDMHSGISYSNDKSGGYPCASYDLGHGNSQSFGNSLSKPNLEDNSSADNIILKGNLIPGATIIKCTHYCFTLWLTDPNNKSKPSVSKQGCWLDSPRDAPCMKDVCVSNSAPKKNYTHFCCCSGYGCNVKFKDTYNPSEHSTTTTLASPLTDGPLLDHNYRQKTIIIALVSVISVSLVVVFSYLSYRICLTPKTTSIPSESSGTRTDQGGMTPSSIMDIDWEKLTFKDSLVCGRYSEIRRGKLGEKEVAIKIYNHPHKQYYYNERDAYTLPFLEHENIVKFYGAKEQVTLGSNQRQYLIVLDYLPLGSLTNYLKNNSIDWNSLCIMSQGIAKGLAHLHTDIQHGDLFKPALAHRDLNTRNILVTTDLRCVITDLGFSTAMMGSKLIRNGVAEHAEQASLADVGTLCYMAPEVFDGAVNLRDCEASLKQIDIYSLGLVIWELANRCVDLYQGAPLPEYRLPFQVEAGPHPTFDEMHDLVVKYKTRPKFPDVWKDSSSAVRSLKETIEDCWDSDSEARLTALCVQERIADMAVLWTNGIKHRGVTPTLNATMNLPEGSQTSPGAFVSNGVAYLPQFVERTNENDSLEVQDEESQRRRMDLNSPFLANARTFGQSELTTERDDAVEGTVTTPLINNLNHHSTKRVPNAKRVKSWLQDQSVSESTVETLLSTTPSAEDQNSLPNSAEQFESHVTYSGTLPGVKANNVFLAHNRPVISHPNQGRNPTVERNTHKHSDEELTVSGNRLIAPGNPLAQPHKSVTGQVDPRRNSIGAQSARLSHGIMGSYDGLETGTDYTSLVQHDTLSHQHLHRNVPIPYVQNQVHSDLNTTSGNPTPRIKLANVNGETGGLSIHSQGVEVGENMNTLNSSSVRRDFSNKSLKHKLSRIIRPKDLGLKFAHIVFGSKISKAHSTYSPAVSQDLESASNVTSSSATWQRSPLPPNEISNHYINRGLESSPTGRGEGNLSQMRQSNVTMEVKLINGIPVANVLPSSEVGVLAADERENSGFHNPELRLSSTNIMRMGALAQSNNSSQTPSLFSSMSQSVESENSEKRNSREVELVSMNYLPESAVTSASTSRDTDSTSVQLDDLNPISSELIQESAPNVHDKLKIHNSKNVEKDVMKENLEDISKGLDKSSAACGHSNSYCGDKEKVMKVALYSSSLHSTSPQSQISHQVNESPCSEAETNISVDPLYVSQPVKSSSGPTVICEGVDANGVSDKNCLGEQSYMMEEINAKTIESPSLLRQSRPQSLSVKGHSYMRQRKLAREKAMSLAPSRPSSDTNSSDPELDFSAKSDCAGQTMADPNKNMNKKSIQSKDTRSSSAACGNKKMLPNSSGDQKGEKPRSRASKSQQLNSLSVSKEKELTNSRDKIRRRIKTPISFKNARLSLYDDRLMSQGLDDLNFQAVVSENDIPLTQSFHPDSQTRNESNQSERKSCKSQSGCVVYPQSISQLTQGDDSLVACPVDISLPVGCNQPGTFSESFKLVRSTSNLVI